ncbi:MAG TPA: serine hydrolase domain-containing protein [Pseudomonadales bacterium]|nr:serine hydrolase domain-containing protein [Pseudomonadales bacterium]
MTSKSLNRGALARIPETLQAALDTGELSGFVTLVWHKGEIVQVDAIGQRDIEAGLPMQRDTIFAIASMTKPVTTVAALQLIEEGKLKLESPIREWLPEFSNPRVLKDAAGPIDDTEPVVRDITVEDLMTHRSGLAYDFSSKGPIAKAIREKLGGAISPAKPPEAWLADLASLPLSYQPGERMHYSLSTDVLGLLVGRVDGKSFRESLKDRVLDPLNMSDTDFWVPPEKRDRAANIYQFNVAAGKLLRAEWAVQRASVLPSMCSGGGGLYSTVDDYIQFAHMLVDQGEVNGVRLLSEDTVQLMRTNRLTPEQRQMPFLGMPFWTATGFGLGVSVVMDPEKLVGAGSKGSFGWPGAFGTWWQADPQEQLIVIYMIQNDRDLSPEAIAALSTAQPTAATMALPTFQKGVYAALED